MNPKALEESLKTGENKSVSSLFIQKEQMEIFRGIQKMGLGNRFRGGDKKRVSV